MYISRRLNCCLLTLACLTAHATAHSATTRNGSQLRFEVSFASQQSGQPLDGRFYVMLSTDDKAEPRFQIDDNPDTQQFFGADVDQLAPGKAAVIDASTLGYPADSLASIPAGDYYVQGLLNIYETYHLANGHTVKLPPNGARGSSGTKSPAISTASR